MVLRCLIVDDSVYFLHAARVLLEREGSVVVDVASTGVEAMNRAGSDQPDVILLDINLGHESGFDVARRIEQNLTSGKSKGTGPRIILISTHAEEDFQELIAASPAVGFLSKTALSAGAIQEVLSSGGSCS